MIILSKTIGFMTKCCLWPPSKKTFNPPSKIFTNILWAFAYIKTVCAVTHNNISLCVNRSGLLRITLKVWRKSSLLRARPWPDRPPSRMRSRAVSSPRSSGLTESKSQLSSFTHLLLFLFPGEHTHKKKIYWRMKTCNVKLRNLHKSSIKWPYNSWTVLQNFLCTQRFIIHLKNYTEIDYKLHWNWSPLSAVAQMLFALTYIQTWRCIAPCLMTLITLVLLWPAVPWQVWTCWSMNEITVEGNTFIALKKLKDDFKWLQWHSMLLLTFWAFCHCQLSTVVV